MKRTTLVASLTVAPEDDGDALRHLSDEADVLEVRADLVGDLDPDWLRDRFDGQLLYTLRSRKEGGAFEGGKNSRRRRLGEAAKGYDLVDLEAQRDVSDEQLALVREEQRVLSWHGTASYLTELKERFESMASTPARFYKLISETHQEGDALRSLALLDDLKRDDLIAFCMGDLGSWTRIVAPFLGSPWVYAAWGDVPAAPGQISIERLRRDFGFPELREPHGLYGIIGNPVSHSLSPRLHNGAYRELGFDGLYVPFHVESFGDFWLDVVEVDALASFGLPLKGLSVTSPHKEAALAVAGASSPRADRIGAANTLVLHERVWEAESTDPEGVVGALQALGVSLEGRPAAVVGCGGAGRAAAVGLDLAHCKVTLVNRGRERGERASEEMHLPFLPLDDFNPADYDIIAHATSLGHHADDPLPFDTSQLRSDTAVVEMVYGGGTTALQREAAKRGCTVVDGRSVLMHQAFGQFRLHTDLRLDPELAETLLAPRKSS